MKQVMPKPLLAKTLPDFFLNSSLKSISTFKTKSLMKPDTFDFKSLPAFLQQQYTRHYLIISP